MKVETFRVVPSTTPLPSALMTARRYYSAEAAIADMGDGVVVSHREGDGLRLVAYHERHAAYVERTEGRIVITTRHEDQRANGYAWLVGEFAEWRDRALAEAERLLGPDRGE